MPPVLVLVPADPAEPPCVEPLAPPSPPWLDEVVSPVWLEEPLPSQPPSAAPAREARRRRGWREARRAVTASIATDYLLRGGIVTLVVAVDLPEGEGIVREAAFANQGPVSVFP